MLHPTGAPPSFKAERTWDQTNVPTRGRSRKRKVYRTGGPFVNLKIVSPLLEARGPIELSTDGRPGMGDWRWSIEGCKFLNPDFSASPLWSYINNYHTFGYAGNPFIPSTAAYEPRAMGMAPTFEKASAFNAVYELREAPAMLRQTGKAFHEFWKDLNFGSTVGGRLNRQLHWMTPKRASNEFLNTQFGWIPFIRDINAMCDAVIFSEQYINDLSSSNGQWIKRKKVLEDVESSERIFREYTLGCEPAGWQIAAMMREVEIDGVTCGAVHDLYDESVTQVWAEGAFKHYRPEFDRSLEDYNSVFRNIQRHIALYGANISPSHIYKAIPWSWAIDWFSNTGRIIQQAEAEINDALVTKYLYIMHHKTRRVVSRHHGFFWSGEQAFEWTQYIESKQRQTADSPYGFGLDWSDLSPSRIAILTALGISRKG